MVPETPEATTTEFQDTGSINSMEAMYEQIGELHLALTADKWNVKGYDSKWGGRT